MANRLSHSAATKHGHCGEAYRLHYNEKIRPLRTHAALAFGTANDRSIDALLKNEGNPKEIFLATWTNQKINDVDTYLPTCIDIVYAEADFDSDLIDQSLLPEFKVTMEEIEQTIKYKEEVGYEKLPDEYKVIANIGYWLTLRTKGLLMIEAYYRDVLPKIVRVISVQEKFSLENGAGDELIGFIDLVAEFIEHGVVITDNKTSARDYKPDSVAYSPQLILYKNAVGPKYGTNKAGFIVQSKQIIKNKKKICTLCNYDGSEGRAKTCDQEFEKMVANKKGVEAPKMVRCNGEWKETINPKARVQIIIDTIADAAEDLVLSNIDDINTSINNGVYTKNLANCQNSFGKPCDYIGLCWKGSMEGLVKK